METCICAECSDHIAGDEGERYYCNVKTKNLDGLCDDCRLNWSKKELDELAKE